MVSARGLQPTTEWHDKNGERRRGQPERKQWNTEENMPEIRTIVWF